MNLQRCEPVFHQCLAGWDCRLPWSITDDPSAVSSPTTSLASTQKPFLPVHSGPAPGCRLLSYTAVLFKAPCYQIKHIFFISMFVFMYYLYETEKEMATHSSFLAWRIPWTEEPGRPWSMGSQRVGHNWSDWAHYLYEKYYKPIIEQNDTVECISWEPRLTLLDWT